MPYPSAYVRWFLYRVNWLSPLQIRVLALVFSAIVLEGVDIQVIGLAAPLIIREWAITRAALGPAMAASLIGTAIGASVGGYGDRFGRRPVLIFSVTVFGLMTLLAVFAQNVVQLALLRLAAGIGFGAVLSTAPPLIAESLPQHLRGSAVALMIVGVPVGGMLGAAGAGFVIPEFGWRAAFAAGGLVPLVLGLLLWFALPESPEFSSSESAREASTRSWAMLFSPECARTTLGLAVSFSANLAVSYAFFNWTPTLLIALHVPLNVALSSLFYFNLSGAIGTVLVARMMMKWGSKPGLVALVILGVVSAVLLLVAIAAPSPLTQGVAEAHWLTLTISMAGIATVASQAALYALAAQAYPTSCRATGIGFAGTVGRMGAILSALGGGIVLDLPSGVSVFVLTVAALFMLSGLGVFIVDRHTAAAT